MIFNYLLSLDPFILSIEFFGENNINSINLE